MSAFTELHIIPEREVLTSPGSQSLQRLCSDSAAGEAIAEAANAERTRRTKDGVVKRIMTVLDEGGET